jgi:hypothetical protein
MLTLLASLLGFAALALATHRHQEALFGRPLATRTIRMLRLAGWSALAVGLWIIVAGQGWGLGLVSYSGHTSLAAGAVYLALIVRERCG